MTAARNCSQPLADVIDLADGVVEGHAWPLVPDGEYLAGKVTEAIILLNAFSVTTAWFRPLWDFTLCFAHERVKFLRPGNEPGSAPANGSVFVYLGPSPEKFAQVYGELGPVVQKFREAA
jgi:hypothetical protein